MRAPFRLPTIAAVASALALACGPSSDQPTGPGLDAAPGAGVQPQVVDASRRYDLSKVPARFFAAPGDRLPRGYGASPALTQRELDALALSTRVVNGGFERNGGVGSSDFAGWTTVNFTDTVNFGGWLVQAGTASPLVGFIAFVPPAGEFAAMTDQFGPGTHILYQDVKVPSGRSTLSFRVSLFNQAGVYVTPNTLKADRVANQQFRMDIMGPLSKVDGLGNGVLRMVYRTEAGDPPLQGYTTVRTSLNAFAGRTVRLRFAEVDNLGNFNVGIDQVRIIVE